MTVSNYESRLERLEQELVPTDVEPRAVAYLHDSDTRQDDWMEVRLAGRTEVHGQRFDRGANEDVDDFQRRVLESLGLAERNVIIVSYVGSNGNGRPKLPADVDTCEPS
jgi:hypothetical protein